MATRCVAEGGIEASSGPPLRSYPLPPVNTRSIIDAGVRRWETIMKLYQNPVWLALCLSITPSAILWAAGQPPTIVVSASRIEEQHIETPASITLITRQEIEASGARDLPQLLQARGGLQISSLNGTAQSATIDMRGFGPAASRNTLVLVDGRRLNNSGDLAAPDLASIDLRGVERIEIVQGSAGTLYGNQAVGGLINIITRTRQNIAKVEAGLGSYKGRTVRMDLSQSADNGFSSRVSAKRETSENYRDNNESKYQDFNLRLDYDHNQGRAFIEYQAVNDRQQLPGALFADEIADNRRQSAIAYTGDYSDAQTNVTRIGLEQDLSLNWQLVAEASYRNNDREFLSSFRSFPGSLATQTRRVKGLNPRLIGLFTLPSGEATLTLKQDRLRQRKHPAQRQSQLRFYRAGRAPFKQSSTLLATRRKLPLRHRGRTHQYPLRPTNGT
ncbi:MAG: TonB-dependent receptor plug domain-containing protein [Candidatus Thiodiazotropha sp.]